MKKIFLALILLGNGVLNSQTYFEKNDCWTNALISDQGGVIISKSQCFVDNDTTLFGKVYKNIRQRDNEIETNYMGSIRSDFKKIYANVVIGTDTLQDILLYDFGAEIGDTVFSLPLTSTMNHYSNLSENKIVKNTDSVELINGEKRKRIYLDNGDVWIEGIGSVNGLFSLAYPIPTSSTHSFLSCFKHNNIELYQNNELCHENCCELLSGVSVPNEVEKFSILFPAATDNYTYIKTNNLVNLIEIRDVYGRCLKTIVTQRVSKYTLDFTNYSSGIYFVLVYSENRYEAHKLIRY